MVRFRPEPPPDSQEVTAQTPVPGFFVCHTLDPPEAAPGDPPHQREDVGTRHGRNEAKQDKEFSALGAKQKGLGKGASRPGHSQDRQIHLPGFLSFTILPGSPPDMATGPIRAPRSRVKCCTVGEGRYPRG